MAATIFSTRFALQAIGIDAFGVYTVVASLPLLLTVLTGAMSAVTQRMLAIGLNKTPSESRRIFNACLGPHLAVALLIELGGETIGWWMLHNVLQIPPELQNSAEVSLHIVVAGSAFGALLAPYDALMRAHERFGLFTTLEVLKAASILIGSWYLLSYNGDRLVGYTAVQAISMASVLIIGALTTALLLPEGRISPLSLFNRSDLRERSSLISWTIVGAFSTMMRQQGLLVLTNALFGPAASAAMGVGNQLIGVMRQLSMAISQAFVPRIYKSEADGDRNHMIELTLLSCKYSALVGAVIAVPLVIESHSVLDFWLKTPPPGAATVLFFLALSLLVDQLSTPISIAHLAIGRIAKYHSVCGPIGISVVPIGYLIAELGGDLSAVLSALVATSGIVATMRLVLLEPHVFGALQSWLKKVAVPIGLTFSAGLIAAVLVERAIAPGFGRVVATTTISSATSLFVVYYLMPTWEKSMLKTLLPRHIR